MSRALLNQPGSLTLLNAVTTATDSAKIPLKRGQKYVIAAFAAGTGAITANVLVYGSAQDVADADDVTRWSLLTTLALSGTTTAEEPAVLDAPWAWLYVRAQDHTGTGTAVTVDLSVG